MFGKSEFQDTEVIELFPLSDGLRVLTSSKGFYSYRNKVLRPWAVLKSILQSELVYSGHQSINGNYMIGTVTNGLYIVSEDGRENKHFNFEKGLLNNTVLSIYEDKDFNLWLGLDNGINCVLTNSPFEIYNDPKGQLGTVYASIRYQNKLYIATNRGLFFPITQSRRIRVFICERIVWPELEFRNRMGFYLLVMIADHLS